MKYRSSIVTSLLAMSVALAPLPALSQEAEALIRMDSLTYHLEDEDAAAAWEADALNGKVLAQGLKFDSSGAMYVTTARWGGASMPATVSKLVKQGEDYVLEPFPSAEMNAIDNAAGLKAVLGFEIDENDVMWLLDQGHVAGAPSEDGAEKLVLWDIKAQEEIQRLEFDANLSDKTCSFLNDVVVDNGAGFAYISDSGIFGDPLCGGLIVYNREANTARRVLSGSRFTNDDANFMFNINGRRVLESGPMRTGADGIALSGDGTTLYWTSLTGNTLYSVPTALLQDGAVSDAEIEAAVRIETTLPSNTDGMTSDKDGNIYLTALQLNSVLKWDPARRELTRIAYDAEMVWPDTLAWSPENDLHVISNHLHLWVDGVMNFDNPDVPNFTIWKLPVNAPSYLK